jgi:hypothetical protein
MKHVLLLLLAPFLFASTGLAFDEGVDEQSTRRLARRLKQFPAADANKDGLLTIEEARAFRDRLRPQTQRGAPSNFKVDPGWDAARFPDHAVSYRTPQEIADILGKLSGRNRGTVTSYDKPTDGSLRIVGTGHSFMAPGFKTFPAITRAAGLAQPPLLTHTGGGITGSARYKWEEENGIFQFDGKPKPKLLASIANAQWDAMMWGPYYADRPQYYACWIAFCLKYNPEMTFFLSDAWPQLGQLSKTPSSEEELTSELFVRLGQEKNEAHAALLATLSKKYPQKVFIMPTSDAMVLAVQYYNRGELPGVEGIHKVVGKKDRSLWRDRLGHLGPGFGNLEGYVFYATIYGRSPELIKQDVKFGGSRDYPSRELDRVFRKIAWEAVVNHPLSGVQDKNKNGVADNRE